MIDQKNDVQSSYIISLRLVQQIQYILREHHRIITISLTHDMIYQADTYFEKITMNGGEDSGGRAEESTHLY